MKLSNPVLFCIACCGNQADSTSGAQTLMRGGRNCLPLASILPPQAENMMDYNGKQSDDDAEM